MVQALPNVPASALSSYVNNFPATSMTIGTNWIPMPGSSTQGLYWYVAVDLTNLNVVQNLVSTDPTSVPPAIQALAGNSRYFLFFISNWQPSYNIPTGALYQFLLAIGAGPGLISGEQMIEQLGTGYITHFSYVLAASLSANNVPGFEVFSEVHFEVLTMQFMPVTVDGQTTYAPVSIGGLQP